MLTFHNPGVIDIRGATIAGLSAKENESAIGFFGTGLKYSIASILRMGGSIVIYAGLKKYEFTTEDLTFRGKDFSQILMNKYPISLTTEYGKMWMQWQIFRELYANAKDEGGSVSSFKIEPKEGFTTIHVNCLEIEEQFQHKDLIILPDMVTCFENNDIKVSNQPSNIVYYRSVRVLDKICVATYNVLEGVSLTEDRTVSNIWSLKSILAGAVMKMTDETMIQKIICAPKECFEGEFDYRVSSLYNPSNEFLNVCKRLFRQDSKKFENLLEIINHYAPELTEPKVIELTSMRKKMLDRAINFTERMGHKPSEIPIIIAELGNSTMGKYCDGKIYLDPINFEKGTKTVVSTLLEELVHHETGKSDCCYDMQTYLFDRIVSLYEEHVFEEMM